jgi:hypothetical protein
MLILFASTTGAGHVGPLLPIAAAAQAAGHEVLVATAPKSERHVRRAGLPWHALDAATPESIAAAEQRLAPLGGVERVATAVVERSAAATAALRSTGCSASSTSAAPT